MRRQFCLWAALLILGMAAGLEAGEIYQWIDKDGVRHFTDGPPPPGAQMVEGLSQGQAEDLPARTGAADEDTAGAVEGNDTGLNDVEEPAALEAGGEASTSREEYWRRRGWEDGPSGGGGEAGALEGGEKSPAEAEEVLTEGEADTSAE